MKIVVSIFIISFLLMSCGASNTVYTNKKRQTKKRTSSTNNNPTLADKIIWTAVSYKGTPYKYGGTTRSGMDCSGLIMVSFKERGIYLPRTSHEMAMEGRVISLREAKRGDLLFFRTNPRKPNRISHVGLVTHTKNGAVYFIHASTKKGVTVNDTSEKYYRRAFIKAKRIL